ncbi:hypothetical protein [Burkholderia mayonis]|uniref:hypothetical protein n=1 Tax=Burkholderia mayonis TaxID=1385591 RepID=UPI00131EF65E|nr:hypothetical protein [Burkholderia mayonis]
MNGYRALRLKSRFVACSPAAARINTDLQSDAIAFESRISNAASGSPSRVVGKMFQCRHDRQARSAMRRAGDHGKITEKMTRTRKDVAVAGESSHRRPGGSSTLPHLVNGGIPPRERSPSHAFQRNVDLKASREIHMAVDIQAPVHVDDRLLASSPRKRNG